MPADRRGVKKDGNEGGQKDGVGSGPQRPDPGENTVSPVFSSFFVLTNLVRPVGRVACEGAAEIARERSLDRGPASADRERPASRRTTEGGNRGNHGKLAKKQAPTTNDDH